MARQRTDYDASARRAEIQDTQAHDNKQDHELAVALLLGVLVMVTAISSAIAAWMAN